METEPVVKTSALNYILNFLWSRRCEAPDTNNQCLLDSQWISKQVGRVAEAVPTGWMRDSQEVLWQESVAERHMTLAFKHGTGPGGSHFTHTVWCHSGGFWQPGGDRCCLEGSIRIHCLVEGILRALLCPEC